MKLSSILELLIILLLIAFAAYARVIDHEISANGRINNQLQNTLGVPLSSIKQATDSVNKYCVCNEKICNCCKDFHIPLVGVNGPGCASLQYLRDDNLAIQLSFGENILTNTIVNGKNPKPVCVLMPGGFSKFCGRIYSIKRENDRYFKACLGLELQSAADLEASLRVSCFRFGPDGLKLRPAEPLPTVITDTVNNNKDDDEDDDIFGLGNYENDDDDDVDEDDEDDEDDDDDDDDDKKDVNESNNVENLNGQEIKPVLLTIPSNEDDSVNDDEDDDEDDDLLGFSALFDIFSSDSESPIKKTKVSTSTLSTPTFTIPFLTANTPQSASNLLLGVELQSSTAIVSNSNSDIDVSDVTFRPNTFYTDNNFKNDTSVDVQIYMTNNTQGNNLHRINCEIMWDNENIDIGVNLNNKMCLNTNKENINIDKNAFNATYIPRPIVSVLSGNRKKNEKDSLKNDKHRNKFHNENPTPPATSIDNNHSGVLQEELNDYDNHKNDNDSNENEDYEDDDSDNAEDHNDVDNDEDIDNVNDEDDDNDDDDNDDDDDDEEVEDDVEDDVDVDNNNHKLDYDVHGDSDVNSDGDIADIYNDGKDDNDQF
ncbi:protein PFC0760c-like [Leptopilina heterotoma]|uniref:protein PFC0760c-like n=1 Tax=Leptopilina heterotoma TaxID=63436 RepID=UPI001CA7E079|nr:protein PFC0760c-like [Leptopilina heterotoma]